ncbi:MULTISPECIES: TRAP transporter small permease [Paenibacillus]|uniref:TRAP transporter small permease subunit n=1 Tax=Paenibacillus validus TaxID=44253 RepID=A0A7X2Z813_9BACL|nr:MULTISPECIES: TRAP transporter small permease [Paenibacillus]MUG70009.1 TRAP transporter small permease subunit [Paenibacillus validus]
MGKLTAWLDQVLNVIMAIFMAAMAIFTFGNVILRYAFDSGITWSEELSRFLFVYLVFLGAVAALKEKQHLGVDSLVKRLPAPLKRFVYVLSHLLMLITMVLVGDGSWRMTLMSIDTQAPATGMSLAFVYGIGIITSICMGLILLSNIIRVIVDKSSIEKLAKTLDSEEEIKLERSRLQTAEGVET